MTLGRGALLLGASILAGAVNSIAGGGTLISFPAAIAVGLPPIVANATNAVAMVPGSLGAAWAYRRHLAGLERLTGALALPAIAGALLGAFILRHTPQRLFDGVVPWLVLGATALILVQGVILRRAHHEQPAPSARLGRVSDGPPGSDRPRGVLPILALQLLVSVYGGYFGAAMGIVMLAFLGYVKQPDSGAPLELNQMNAVKNVLAVVINGAASIDFLAHGLVRPQEAALMAAGAVAGGMAGGRLARGARPVRVRWFIVALGLAMAALLAWRRYA